ncbi:MAG: hypothetical protein ABR571_10100 [Jatrophihabitans sp.]|uniref:hypothetical protein n=1 Tax=Jatrophihabitans sp. TaxID=1932789 RepID=UPI0039124FD0
MPATQDDYDMAIEWTDGGLVFHRLHWMSDEQWREMKDKMQEWWAEYMPAFLASRDAKRAGR